jgi:hypothetical protein
MFVRGVSARTAAELVGVNRHAATLFDQKIRAMIADRPALPRKTVGWHGRDEYAQALSRLLPAEYVNHCR